MIFGGNMVLWSVIFLLMLGSFGKSLIKLFMILFSVALLVSLELGISGSGLLGLVLFLTYASGMLVLFLYMFCLFSKTFNFLTETWNWSVGMGLVLCSVIFFSVKSKKNIYEDVGEEMGIFLDSGSLFLGCFFTTLFMLALWIIFKILCFKKGCLRPFY